MKKIIASSALALGVFCFLESPSAKAQEFFFPNAYSRPVETVDGIDVGSRFDTGTEFAPAPAAPVGRRQIAHRIAR
jgi:hypothetical protein